MAEEHEEKRLASIEQFLDGEWEGFAKDVLHLREQDDPQLFGRAKMIFFAGALAGMGGAHCSAAWLEKKIGEKVSLLGKLYGAEGFV